MTGKNCLYCYMLPITKLYFMKMGKKLFLMIFTKDGSKSLLINGMGEISMKCVAYCRVSKDTSDQLNSLENQIRHYSDLFKQKGYEGAECGMYYGKDGKEETVRYIPSIFADEGISGTKLKNREAFKYMLECAYRKELTLFMLKYSKWAEVLKTVQHIKEA